MKRVTGLLKDKKKYFVCVLLMTFLYGSVFPIFALLLTKIMVALINNDFESADLIIGLFAVLAVSSFIVAFIVQYLYQYIGSYVTTVMREMAFNAILRK